MNLIRAIALGALTICIVAGVANVEVILAALFVLGTTDTFTNTASGAILPMIVDKPDLGVANARLTFGWVGLGQLTGPPIGAVLFTVGTAWPFAGETICGLTGTLLFTRVLLTPHARDTGRRRHLRQEIAEGIRWTRDNAAMRALVIQIVTFNVTYGASWSVLVLYSRQRLGLGTVGFGLLTVATAVGSVLGSVTYGWLERHVRLASIMRYGLVLETFTHLVLAVTRSPAVAMIILFLFGVHLASWATTASSVRQRAVPMDLQGRVGSVYTFALMGGLVVGSALGGALASRWGITAP